LTPSGFAIAARKASILAVTRPDALAEMLALEVEANPSQATVVALVLAIEHAIDRPD
jgi:hypothetical protein